MLYILHDDENFGSACQNFFDLYAVRVFQLFHDRYLLLDLGPQILCQDLMLVNYLHRHQLTGVHVFSEFDLTECASPKCFDEFVSVHAHVWICSGWLFHLVRVEDGGHWIDDIGKDRGENITFPRRPHAFLL